MREGFLNLVPLMCHVLKHRKTALVGSWQEKLLPKAELGSSLGLHPDSTAFLGYLLKPPLSICVGGPQLHKAGEKAG